jgi:hypothetical protein
MDTLEFALSRYGWVLVCFVLAAVLLYGGIRGGYARDRIQLTDAYPGLSPKAAILVLNGPYTALTHYL